MLAKSATVKRYEQRTKQFRQNRIFDLNQKKIYAELNRNGIRWNDVTNAKECIKRLGAIFGMSEKRISEKQNG